MTDHPDGTADIWAFVLGALPDDEHQAFAARVAADAALAADVARARDELGDVAVAALPEETPSDAAVARLQAALDDDTPYPWVLQRLAQAADLAVDVMRGIVRAAQDASGWVEGPCPGVTLFHVDGGPRTADAVVGFVRIPSGGQFDHHVHAGLETTFMLEGRLECTTGRTFEAGDIIDMPEGSEHALLNRTDASAMFFVVVEKGVSLGDTFIGPGDPAL